jgi:hypothetical protein
MFCPMRKDPLGLSLSKPVLSFAEGATRNASKTGAC